MTARLRPTWVPEQARRYRRPGGPWDVPTLDALLAAHGGEVVDGATRLSATEADALVATVAGGLRERGVRRGEAVAWQVPNSLAAAVLTRACWRIGAVAAPVLHSFGAADVEAALDQIDPALVLELGSEAFSDPGALADAVGGAPVPSGAFPSRPSDVALVLFTSGSTGIPKAVLHTQRGLSWKASLMARVHGLGPADAVLMPAPMAHISGLLNGVLVPGAAGLRSVLVRRFDPEQALALVARERISFLAGPADLLHRHGPRPGRRARHRRVLDPAGVQWRRVGDTGLRGGHGAHLRLPCEAHVRLDRGAHGHHEHRRRSVREGPRHRRARRRRRRAPHLGPRDGRAAVPPERRASCGCAAPRCSPGTPTPHRPAPSSRGAAGSARATWPRSTRDGWVRIVGRLKDVIIRGGENISASEVEAALEAHPDVHHAVAVGYPDPLMGERVAAFVESAAPFDLEECRRWFAGRGMAVFKTPEKVERLDHLPLLGSGKPDRAALQRRAAT